MLIEPQTLKRLETLNWCEKCSTLANLDSFQVDGFVESVLGFAKTRKIFEAVKLGEDVRKVRTIPVPAETFFRNILRLVDHDLLIFHPLRDRKPGSGPIKTNWSTRDVESTLPPEVNTLSFPREKFWKNPPLYVNCQFFGLAYKFYNHSLQIKFVFPSYSSTRTIVRTLSQHQAGFKPITSGSWGMHSASKLWFEDLKRPRDRIPGLIKVFSLLIKHVVLQATQLGIHF